MIPFLRLSRPVFLVGGGLLFGLGVAASGSFPGWGRYLAGQAMVTAVQLTAQYVNEHFDVEADRNAARTWFSGGSGVLPAGGLPSRTAWRAALATSALAALAIIAVATWAASAAAIGSVGLLGAWAYSAPPARLVASGWGEFVASAEVAVMVPFAGTLVAGAAPEGDLLFMVASLWCAHLAMIVALSVPDLATDEAAGKRTMVVRAGLRRGRAVHRLALAGATLAVGTGALLGSLSGWQAGGAAIAAPAAGVQVWSMASGSARPGVLTTAAVATFAVLTGGLLAGTAIT